VSKSTKRSRVQKLQQQQTALAQFGAYAFRQPDLQSILTEGARLCAEGLNVPYCKVLRYRAEENDLIVEAGIGWKENVVGRSLAQADESSPVGRAFLTGRPVITRDLRKAHDFILPSIYPEHRIVSSVNVIIQGSGDRPYGVLEVDTSKLRVFDQQDIRFLEGFANVLAEAVATAQRITALRSAIAERDGLARELQHRVRNNLQVIYRMLDLEARKAKDAKAKRTFEAVARRVIVLAQVYEHLLSVGIAATLDFGKYLEELCARLSEFYETAVPGVKLNCQVERHFIDVDRASALGLAVNELITNSYDHAFSEKQKGNIEVVLRRTDGSLALTVADDGAGFGPKQNKGYGLDLVRGFCRQARGHAEVQSDGNGTVWTITVPTR
jgi:two-component sensor histidine kinase